MALVLRDPRQYSIIYPESNLLLSQAQVDLAGSTPDNGLMCALIEDLLKQGQDQLLSVAYNLAPSQAIADYIWQSLQQVLLPVTPGLKWYALPVVLIVGSKQAIELPLDFEASAIGQLLAEKGVITNLEACVIGSKMVDSAGLSSLQPSQIYNSFNQDLAAASAIIANMHTQPVLNVGAAVHLRYLLLATHDAEVGQSPLVVANFSQLGLELMQLLQASLTVDGVSLFPLPFAPVGLGEAIAYGERCYHEIKISVQLSDEVKALRQQRQQAQLKLATNEHGIIIELWNAHSVVKQWLWPVQRSDNFLQICQILETLFNDMQLPISYSEL